MCVRAGGGGNLARYDALNQHHLLHDCTISLSATHALFLFYTSLYSSLPTYFQALMCKSICPRVCRGEVQQGRVSRRLKNISQNMVKTTPQTIELQYACSRNHFLSCKFSFEFFFSTSQQENTVSVCVLILIILSYDVFLTYCLKHRKHQPHVSISNNYNDSHQEAYRF